MATLRQKRYAWLKTKGLAPKEARALAKRYSISDFRHLPYLSRMLRTRRLQVSSLKSKGYTDSQITQQILYQYTRRGWFTGQEPDVWKMLRDIRKDSIRSGDYIPPRRSVSHHSRREIEARGSHKQGQSFMERYLRRQGRI